MNSATGTLTVLERLKIDNEITQLVRQRSTLTEGAPLYAQKLAQIAGKLVALLKRRGVDLKSPASREREAFQPDGAPDVPESPRAPTSQFYEFDPTRKHGERRKDNAAALALLAQIDAGEVDGSALTDEQKATLAKYSGTGGNLTGADGLKGSAYEYYTPKPIAEGMWSMLSEMGFAGGKVSDPCAGVGIFGATAPSSVAMESVELNSTSGRINQLVNGGPDYNAIVSPYEAVASRTDDEIYDAVVTNVPFGGVHDRGSNRLIDPKYQDQPLETYFILRSLEKLRPGGLAAFVVPPRIVSAKGGREEALRLAASFKAEFMGAYRLPNSVFGTADADTITDVIVFRKFGRDVASKIEELREQNTDLLIQTNVLWTEFIGGKYFQGEGHRYVLGTFVAKDSTKFRDVDRVISDQSVANIGKLLRKFPGSRIDWKTLEATETEPIIYNDGDTITLAGQTLVMRDNRWVPAGKAVDDGRMASLGPTMRTPLAATQARVAWELAVEYLDYLRAMSMDMQTPQWLRQAREDIEGLPVNERNRMWPALTAGLAAIDVMQTHSSEGGFNYLESYPVLSDVLIETAPSAVRAPAGFSRIGKDGLQKARVVYDRKDGFSALWRGEGASDVDIGELDENAQIGALQYRVGASIPVESLKKVYGEKFDPHDDDDWCLSGDGQTAMRADDYYVGSVGQFLAKIDAQIAAAEGPLKAKLMRQKEGASARIDVVDPTALRYNIFSPFVTMDERAEFLRRFLHPGFAMEVNNLGKPYIVYKGPSGNNATLEENMMSRIASYVSGNAAGEGVRSLTLQGKQLGIDDREALEKMRGIALRLNTQFDGWVKANRTIMERLHDQARAPERLYFNEIDDTTPVHIPGMNKIDPRTGDPLTLHGYQNSFVRKNARKFGGIAGHDVGLGKTFIALAVAQYVQSIGVKKKTFFVVPNTVLSNWRTEATRAYESMDDCLFIGLESDRNGKQRVVPANYAKDFTRILENRHRKIFCTIEAFSMIPMKEETINAYEDYLMSVDPSYLPAGEDAKKKDFERANSKLADVTNTTGAKSSAIPFFEEMGIDSLICDEAHMFKNSKETLDFSGAKFLSVAEASARGRDMQMKAWYIRGDSDDGVLPLTATPITNSPLEIYSMLTLAAGERKVHDLCMGVQGADQFMDAMCIIEDDEDVGIDGNVKSYRVFRGLQNVEMLRSALGSIATIKTARDVGDELRLPDSEERQSRVQLSAETLGRLEEYKLAYRGARELLKGDNGKPLPEEVDALEAVQSRLGEDVSLIGHPFNLIQKMTALIIDPELDERATFYRIPDGQRADIEQVIEKFNKLKKIEKRSRSGPWTSPESVTGQVTVKDGGDEVIVLKIQVHAGLTEDGRVFIDTLDFKTQQTFEDLAEKAGIDLDVSIPPKLAALLENFRNEEATPRSTSGRVKQLIFCDILPLHSKIKRLLVKHAGIPSGAIAIISGPAIANPEQMQDVQDGFNAEGEENRYRAVIGNEKAEVGINLQKGTQAIHHLTIGWTPDSQHQRNGRGVRQGNTTQFINIYHYDADGTFDKYKRRLTTTKADWIGSLMDNNTGNELQIEGGLTSDQYDEMIDSMGDEAKIQAIQDRRAMRERLARAETARARQVINLQTAGSQQKFLKDYESFGAWLELLAGEAFDLNEKIAEIAKRDMSKIKPATAMRMTERKAEMEAKLATLLRDLDDAGEYTRMNMTAKLSDEGWAKTRAKRRETFMQHARYVNTVNQESALYGEWQDQRRQAAEMRDAAYTDYEQIAGKDEGSFSARAVRTFREGGGMIIDGRVFVPGMFIRLKNGNLTCITTNVGGNYKAVRFPDTNMYLADAIQGGEVIGFESPKYQECVIEAARTDDAIPSIQDYQAAMIFSAMNDDVAKARRATTLISLSPTAIELPAPYFRFVIDQPGSAELSDFVKRLIDEQSAVLQWEDRSILIGSDVNFEHSSRGWDSTHRAKEFISWLTGMGLRATVNDMVHVVAGLNGKREIVMGSVRYMFRFPADALPRISAASTREELAALEKTLISEAAPWMETDPAWTIGGYGSSPVINAFSRREVQFKVEEEQAARAAEEANKPPIPDVTPVEQENGATVEDGVDTIAGVVVSATGRIGLTGQTRERVKTAGGNHLMVYELIKMVSDNVGKKAIWRGQSAQWDVAPDAWNSLCKKYPEAAALLNVCPAVK